MESRHTYRESNSVRIVEMGQTGNSPFSKSVGLVLVKRNGSNLWIYS